MQVEFSTKEEAIEHCEKNGWKWYIDGEEKKPVKRVKNYGINFAWNKRTRTSTKWALAILWISSENLLIENKTTKTLV